MNIAFVTPDFINNNGPTSGLPKYLLRVSKVLLKWNHKVIIVTCSDRTVTYFFEGIKIYRVRRPAIVNYNDYEKDAIAACLRDSSIVNGVLEQIQKKELIDIIQYASLSGLAYFHDFDIPAVVRLSSYACMWPVAGREEYQNSLAMVEREAAKKCNAIFGPSFVVAKKFSEDTGVDVDVIETPFIIETDEEDDSIYQENFIKKRYILFYGTLVEHKGLQVIARAAYSILSKYKDIYIGIIGDGNKKFIDEIIRGAAEFSDRIIYHSAMGFSQLKPIIRHAEAVMLPSLMENFSNACVESMALGQIVIGTNGTSFEQLIIDGDNGLLCEPGSSESLANTVDRVLNLSEKQKEAIRLKAIERADLLAPEKVVRQLVEYYKRVIETYNKREITANGKRG